MAADVSAEFTLSPAWGGSLVPPKYAKTMEPFLDGVGRRAVTLAQRLAPKDTGSLASTIRHRVDMARLVPRVVVMAGNAQGVDHFVDYAGHVERGTSRMSPQPYLRPAVRQTVELMSR